MTDLYRLWAAFPELYRQPGNDHLDARDDWARITHPQRQSTLDGFGRVTAVSSHGGLDTKYVWAIDYVLRTRGPWLDICWDPSTG